MPVSNLKQTRDPRHFTICTILLLSALGPGALIGQDHELVPNPGFEVVSIRENTSSEGWSLRFSRNGLNAKNVTLKTLLQEAFGVYDDQLWAGSPAWIGTRQFDIQARFDPTVFAQPNLVERRQMLQELLRTRFQLRVHRDEKKEAVFFLRVRKGGPALPQPNNGSPEQDIAYGTMCNILTSRSGVLQLRSCSMGDLAFQLSTVDEIDRTVLDRTDIKGRFDLELKWSRPSGETQRETLFPSIFTALREQLGLELKSGQAERERIVIDKVSMPSPN